MVNFLTDQVKKFDAFGKSIQLTYNRDTTFSTPHGGAASLVMYVILIIYAINGFVDVVTNQTKSISKAYDKLDLETFDSFSPGEAKF